MVEIPRSLRAIDGAWLTTALREAGHDAPAIDAVSLAPISGVVGSLGEIGVLSVTYAADTDLPQKLVGKCPLDHESARQYNQIMQYHRREAGFYDDVASTVPMRVPECFLNLQAGDDSLLLLEFIDDGVDGDVLIGTSFEAMERLVTDLVRRFEAFLERCVAAAIRWDVPERMGPWR